MDRAIRGGSVCSVFFLADFFFFFFFFFVAPRLYQSYRGVESRVALTNLLRPHRQDRRQAHRRSVLHLHDPVHRPLPSEARVDVVRRPSSLAGSLKLEEGEVMLLG